MNGLHWAVACVLTIVEARNRMSVVWVELVSTFLIKFEDGVGVYMPRVELLWTDSSSA